MPIELNGSLYKLCLVDTNAISEMVKHPSREFRNFIDRMLPRKFLPCFSVFSVLELRQRQDIYESFLELFSVYPCLVLKSHYQMIQEEVRNYPNPSGISSVLCGFPGPLSPPEYTLRKTLDLVFQSQKNRDNEDRLNQDKAKAIQDIVRLVNDYPPACNSYTIKEIRVFLFIQGVAQIYQVSPDFLNSLKIKGEDINIDSFPTVKMIIYTLFYKFYNDPSRRLLDTDAFDLLISALTPYVDAVITEAHQTEVIKKVKSLDHFLDSIETYRLRDLR